MNDPTGKREKWINEAADRRVERLKNLAEVMNRPLFSETNLSEEEKRQDLEARLANPEATVQELQQRASAIGPARAALECLKYAEGLTDGTST